MHRETAAPVLAAEKKSCALFQNVSVINQRLCMQVLGLGVRVLGFRFRVEGFRV